MFGALSAGARSAAAMAMGMGGAIVPRSTHVAKVKVPATPPVLWLQCVECEVSWRNSEGGDCWVCAREGKPGSPFPYAPKPA